MSISSDVFISREEAKHLVYQLLLQEQKALIELAIKSMNDYELTSKLHTDTEFYSITKISKQKKT